MTWARIAGDSGPDTALPSNPVDGQEFAYTADATNGVIWRLKYRSASSSSYKWELVGGAGLFASSAAEVAVSSTTWGGTGPSVTVPLAGDYQVEVSAHFYTSGAVAYGWTSISVGGSTASSNADASIDYPPANGVWTPQYRLLQKTGVAASSVIQMRHQMSANTGNFGMRSMRVIPVRVG